MAAFPPGFQKELRRENPIKIFSKEKYDVVDVLSLWSIIGRRFGIV